MTSKHQLDYESELITELRNDLSIALRAASYFGFSEGVCNHFSVELPDSSRRFLLNPLGVLWENVMPDDIVLIDENGVILAGQHCIETTAMYIHAAIHRLCRKAVVFHTHMPFATSLTLAQQASLDTQLSQTAMRFHGHVAVDLHYNGLALSKSEGERIAMAIGSASIGFLGNHGVVVCGERIDYAFDDLYYLERACQIEVYARSTGLPLAPVAPGIANTVAAQSQKERLQSELFFAQLRKKFV
jgi:ribulose-5-phosphate 4-epimerase/fuculose-1-phosphate aldolase